MFFFFEFLNFFFGFFLIFPLFSSLLYLFSLLLSSFSAFFLFPLSSDEISFDSHKIVKCDLTNFEETEKIIKDFEPNLIIHAAAERRLDRALAEKERFFFILFFIFYFLFFIFYFLFFIFYFLFFIFYFLFFIFYFLFFIFFFKIDSLFCCCFLQIISFI